MNNEEKLINTFAETLGVEKNLVTDTLAYNSIPKWDSVAHMSLIAGLENCFDIMLDTDDIIAMSSVAKAKDIIRKYDILI